MGYINVDTRLYPSAGSLLNTVVNGSLFDKADDIVRAQVLKSGVLSNKARKVGLSRLQEASSRKWADEQVTENLVGWLMIKKVGWLMMKKVGGNVVRDRGREKRRVLERIFEGGTK
jgi:hypothetical protein